MNRDDRRYNEYTKESLKNKCSERSQEVKFRNISGNNDRQTGSWGTFTVNLETSPNGDVGQDQGYECRCEGVNARAQL